MARTHNNYGKSIQNINSVKDEIEKSLDLMFNQIIVDSVGTPYGILLSGNKGERNPKLSRVIPCHQQVIFDSIAVPLFFWKSSWTRQTETNAK